MNVIAPGPVLFMPEKRPAPPATRRLTVTAPFEPNGDQPRAIAELGLYRRHQLVRYVFENNLFDPERAQAEILRRRSV